MKNERCDGCSLDKQCRASAYSWIFFAIGLVATFSVRLVAIFMNYNVAYAKAAWYLGIGGFFIFFLYKFHVENARARLVASEGLAEKVRRGTPLTREDYMLMSALLCSLSSKKDRINYLVIFSSSVVVLLLAVYEDFIKRLW